MSKRKRDTQISFWVTPEEREKILERMKQSGILTYRAFLLKMALNGCIVQLDLSAVRELSALLKNATNNLNQIARRVNQTGNIYQADIRDLQERMEKLDNSAVGIIKELSKL